MDKTQACGRLRFAIASRGGEAGDNDNTVPKGTIEIIEFDPRRLDPAIPEYADDSHEGLAPFDLLSRLRLDYRTATSGAVALVVVVLHALALSPMLFGGSAADTALSPRFGTPDPIQAVIIDDQSASEITPPSLSPPDLRSIQVDLPDIPDRSSADPGLAALYGRYLGQIHARIDRAWLRPRSAIGASMFRCQAEVWQRRDGVVRTVTVQRCNGTARWQQSLVQGIEAASPLPAPPNPAVFAHRVILHFQAVAYRAGELEGKYESGPAALTAGRSMAATSSQFHSLRQALKGSHAARVIELRIVGSRIEVEPQR